MPQTSVSFPTQTDASSLVTTKESVLDHRLQDHPHWHQLNESTFQPVTPEQPDKLKQLLIGHPNHDLVNKVVQGFQTGFSLKYTGPRLNRQPRNLLTAYTHSE